MATFEIEINGWGGEVVLGKISQEAYEFWSVRDDDDEELNNHLFWDAYGDDEPNPITDPLRRIMSSVIATSPHENRFPQRVLVFLRAADIRIQHFH